VEQTVIPFLSANRANVIEISYSVPVMNPEPYQLWRQCHVFLGGEGEEFFRRLNFKKRRFGSWLCFRLHAKKHRTWGTP
jgi:hypothetical protein